MQIATKLLKAINAAIEVDEGTAFRAKLREILPKIEDAYRPSGAPYRKHLGVSLIGADCDRRLWYGYRWFKKPKFDGRMQRLFNRGHLEEARFLAMLSIVPGVQLWYETERGGQYRISHFNGHFGSALDGIIRGVPDMPDVPMYAEMKTINDKGFKKLQENGLQAEKWQHFVQMQLCMDAYELTHGLYIVVNKNDDMLHAEIIAYDSAIAQRYKQRAANIIFTDKVPERIPKASVSYFKCKFCDFSDVCFDMRKPDANCRTCKYSKPTDLGDWACTKGQVAIYNDEVYTGCSEYTPLC